MIKAHVHTTNKKPWYNVTITDTETLETYEAGFNSWFETCEFLHIYNPTHITYSSENSTGARK